MGYFQSHIKRFTNTNGLLPYVDAYLKLEQKDYARNVFKKRVN